MFIHENGDIYVGGHGRPTTTLKAFYQFSDKGNDQGFISRFSNDLSVLKSSTLLPGSFHSNAGEINSLNLAQDPKGNIISAGWCSPKDFPTTPGAFDETQNGGNDTYILKMNLDLSKLLTSTFIGGGKNERWNRMATDKDGNIYVASYTLSTDLPTTKGSYYEKFSGGGNDGFIVRINNNLLSDDFEEFHDAAKRDNLKKVKQLLLANGKLLEETDRYKRNALHAAARYNAVAVSKYLVDKGANVNAKDESGNTPLHLASIYSYDQVADLLLNRNADINALNDDGLTPLYLATYYGTPKMMGLLLSKNADTGKKDKEGNTILHIAVLFSNEKKIMETLKYKPKVDAVNIEGSTPLHFAVRDAKNEKIVTVLIENGADPSATDSTGKNALYFTGAFDTVITEYLLKKGMKINSQDKDGNTVLHNSLQMIINAKNFDPQAGQRMKDKLKLFVEYGADTNIKNSKDKSPMDLANEIGDKELIELLKTKK
jgi:ankyrin repeat protein